MKPTITLLFLSAFFLFITKVHSQDTSKFDGDQLPKYLGKAANSSEVKELKLHYHAEMVNETHYLSKDGVELILKKGILSEINIYQKSAVYGTFTYKLPNEIKFGMSASEVKKKLGRPTISYNSGYCEFTFDKFVLSCWFEADKLSQLGLSIKSD